MLCRSFLQLIGVVTSYSNISLKNNLILLQDEYPNYKNLDIVLLSDIFEHRQEL